LTFSPPGTLTGGVTSSMDDAWAAAYAKISSNSAGRAMHTPSSTNTMQRCLRLRSSRVMVSRNAILPVANSRSVKCTGYS
jgi:hypothetical protein